MTEKELNTIFRLLGLGCGQKLPPVWVQSPRERRLERLWLAVATLGALAIGFCLERHGHPADLPLGWKELVVIVSVLRHAVLAGEVVLYACQDHDADPTPLVSECLGQVVVDYVLLLDGRWWLWLAYSFVLLVRWFLCLR